MCYGARKLDETDRAANSTKKCIAAANSMIQPTKTTRLIAIKGSRYVPTARTRRAWICYMSIRGRRWRTLAGILFFAGVAVGMVGCSIGGPDLSELQPGDCITGEPYLYPPDIGLIDCEEANPATDTMVVFAESTTGESYPGNLEEMGARCAGEGGFFLEPSSDTWDDGDRVGLCWTSVEMGKYRDFGQSSSSPEPDAGEPEPASPDEILEETEVQSPRTKIDDTSTTTTGEEPQSSHDLPVGGTYTVPSIGEITLTQAFVATDQPDDANENNYVEPYDSVPLVLQFHIVTNANAPEGISPDIQAKARDGREFPSSWVEEYDKSSATDKYGELLYVEADKNVYGTVVFTATPPDVAIISYVPEFGLGAKASWDIGVVAELPHKPFPGGDSATAATVNSPDGSEGLSLEEAVRDYYLAAGDEQWVYTYDNLDSQTKGMFTEEEWTQRNQWFWDRNEIIYHILSIESDGESEGSVADVEVRLTGEDGSSWVRNTYWVLEDEEWLHRFSEEETDLFMPDASFEEFVETQTDASS